MTESPPVVITRSLDGIGTDAWSGYLAHALCLGGTCHIRFNGRDIDLQAGDLMIVRQGRLVERVQPAAGFRVMTIWVTAEFIERSTPQSNYGMRGQLALFLNPVMHLEAGQQAVCAKNFEMVAYRLEHPEHHFHREALVCAVQNMILDFYDFHSHLQGGEDAGIGVSNAAADIMRRFLVMLDGGAFRQHRDLAHYADRLCVTPKYLSEVSRKVCGYPANFWIQRYTSLDIARLLRRRDLSLTQIADLLGFSSPAYFSRYVQRNLGMSPSELREHEQ